MDKEMEQKLKGFEAVWRRVGEKALPAPKYPASIMPRKGKKPKRRYDPHKY